MQNTEFKKLSICITTYNRARFLGVTLDHILANVTQDCEIVIVDGGSTDETSQIVGERATRSGCIRYFKQSHNSGIDADYDKAVQLARGEYCWLMTDDDLMKPGAISKVLSVIKEDVSLVLVNVECRDFEMSTSQGNALLFKEDRVYAPEEMGILLAEMGPKILNYVGCVIIRRDIWIARDRESYYGTYFVYIGVIFQRPLPAKTLVIAQPLIIYRRGNSHTFSRKMFEVLLIRWPKIIWSLPLPDSAKLAVCSETPWYNIRKLLFYRAIGSYSYIEFKAFIAPNVTGNLNSLVPAVIALCPRAFVNRFLIAYYSVTRGPYRFHTLYELRDANRKVPGACRGMS